MNAPGLTAGEAKRHHAPVGEDAVPLAGDGALHLFAYEVVGQEHVGAGLALVKDVEHVFAVGALEGALELEALHGAVEELHLAGLQRVAAGEDDALLFGQLHARDADGVGALHGLGARVEDEVAVRLFAKRLHLEQDDGAGLRVVELGVVERLVLLADRLAVDAEAVFGVVLDLDREIAADGLDEDLVEDVDVRVPAADLTFAAGGLPLEVVARSLLQICLAAVVDVRRVAGGVDAEAEDLDVALGVTGLEDREEPRLGALELQELRVLVVLAELLEVLHEAAVGEEAAGLGVRHQAEVVRVVEREDLADRALLLEAHEDVEAEEQVLADGDDVAGHAVVLGANAVVAGDGELLAAELGLAAGVEIFGAPAELRGGLDEPRTDDLVAAALELR